MKRMSKMFIDNPMSPEDTVVFWTEYVLRHKGARHLKPASAQMSLFQLALLDVITMFSVGAVVLILVVYLTVSRIVYWFQRRTTQLQFTISKKIN